MSGNVAVEPLGAGAARVLIDRPDRRNAVDRATLVEMARIVDELVHQSETSVVVVAGRGASFCAGADGGDLGELVRQSDDELASDFRDQAKILDVLRSADVVTIAAVRGFALGFGVAIAASCDLVLAAPDAQFALPEIRFGMAPAMVLPSLFRRVGPSAALRLSVTGERLDAAEAASYGLVDQVVADEPFDDAVASLVDRITAHDTDALHHAVRLVRQLETAGHIDIAAESVRAVRSPAVHKALEEFSK